MIQKSTFDFLSKLEKNNNREWFAENKSYYVAAHENVVEFVGELMEQISTHDEIEMKPPRKVVKRIYRDVRFSKDKTPYRKNIWGGFQRASVARRGGYYFSIHPEGATLGAGFWGPDPADLLRIRKEFEADPDTIRGLLNSKDFISAYGEILGDGVKTAPRGFSKGDPAIDLIRRKQFYVMKDFSLDEVLGKDFVHKFSEGYRPVRPFLDYMTDVLTTDLDGRSIL